MNPGVAPGSSSTKVKRITKISSQSEKNERAKQRCIIKLSGEENFKSIKDSWDALKFKDGEKYESERDGIIINLFAQNLSQIEIRQVLSNVGGYKLDRLSKSKQNNYIDLHVKSKQYNKFALTTVDINLCKTEVDSWPKEDGFPCGHRVPRQYLLEEGITWTKLHDR